MGVGFRLAQPPMGELPSLLQNLCHAFSWGKPFENQWLGKNFIHLA
jgi:hypothetical protein